METQVPQQASAAIGSRAMMVSFHAGVPGVSRTSKSGTYLLAQQTDASESRIKALMRIIPKDDSDMFNAPVRRFRQSTFYAKTMAWGRSGERIIMSDKFSEFMAEFRSAKAEFESGRDQFLSRYPEVVEEAKMRLTGLGMLFNPAHFPSPTEMMSKFKFDLNVSPMVVDADAARILGLSEKELATVRESVRRSIELGQRSVMQDISSRFALALKRAAKTMILSPDKRWSETMISNLDDLCGVAESFIGMVPDDMKATITDVITDVRAKITQHSATEIKGDSEIQVEVMHASMRSLDRLAAWTGVSAMDVSEEAENEIRF